jgi:hypothetical protein
MGRVLLERGLVEPPQPDAPGPFRLGDPEALRALVTDAGLELVTVEEVPVLWRHDDFEGYWATSLDLSRTLAVALETLDPDRVAEVREAVRAALGEYADGGRFAVPGLTRVALARRA